jgi:hypothetical protein
MSSSVADRISNIPSPATEIVIIDAHTTNIKALMLE